MKNYLKMGLLLLAVSLFSCGDGQQKEIAKEEKVLVNPNNTSAIKKTDKPEVNEEPASERVDLVSKGVGPVKSITIPETIDQTLAAEGLDLYEKNCTACHKPNKKHIGPAPKDILSRRTPEWVMNMIINPDKMVQEDPLAKDLLIEFNGSPMSNQGITEDEARAILEYFRTL